MAFWQSSDSAYSGLAKLIHWLSALTIVALFVLGLWMTGLTYYDPWYQDSQTLHIGIGFCLVCLTFFRAFYKIFTHFPSALPAPKWQTVVAHSIHGVFYLLIFAMFVTGYFIESAKGQGLNVFGLFEIPAIVDDIDNLEDTMGEIHEWIAFSIIGLALVHALAAFKHHFIDRDATLKRMLR